MPSAQNRISILGIRMTDPETAAWSSCASAFAAALPGRGAWTASNCGWTWPARACTRATGCGSTRCWSQTWPTRWSRSVSCTATAPTRRTPSTKRLIANISAALQHVKAAAEQFKGLDRCPGASPGMRGRKRRPLFEPATGWIMQTGRPAGPGPVEHSQRMESLCPMRAHLAGWPAFRREADNLS